jgi:hypothetical protein
MPHYERHYLETENDFTKRKIDHHRGILAIVYWFAIAVVLIAVAFIGYAVYESVRVVK